MAIDEQQELLIRCFAWIVSSRGEGHQPTCRIPPDRMPFEWETCNCGRNGLLADVQRAIEVKPFLETNGGELHG